MSWTAFLIWYRPCIISNLSSLCLKVVTESAQQLSVCDAHAALFVGKMLLQEISQTGLKTDYCSLLTVWFSD